MILLLIPGPHDSCLFLFPLLMHDAVTHSSPGYSRLLLVSFESSFKPLINGLESTELQLLTLSLLLLSPKLYFALPETIGLRIAATKLPPARHRAIDVEPDVVILLQSIE